MTAEQQTIAHAGECMCNRCTQLRRDMMNAILEMRADLAAFVEDFRRELRVTLADEISALGARIERLEAKQAGRA